MSVLEVFDFIVSAGNNLVEIMVVACYLAFNLDQLTLVILGGEGIIFKRITVIYISIGWRYHIISKGTLFCIWDGSPTVIVVHQVEVDRWNCLPILLYYYRSQSDHQHQFDELKGRPK